MVIDHEYGKTWLHNDIVYFSYKPNINYDLEMISQVLEIRQKICAGKNYPILVDTRSLKSINKEARDLLAGEEGLKSLTAGAFIVGNFVSKTIGNFFIKVSRPTLPAKLFINEDEALKWLEQYKT